MTSLAAQIGTMIAALVAAIAAFSVAYLARRQVRVEAEAAHNRNVQVQQEQYRRERRKNLYEIRMRVYSRLLLNLHESVDALLLYQEGGSQEAWADCSKKLSALVLSREEMLLVASLPAAEAASGAVDTLLKRAKMVVEGDETLVQIDGPMRSLLVEMRADLGLWEAESSDPSKDVVRRSRKGEE
ncbi:hypothetical protein ABZU32_30925 [Sphaerisporangium sp. NPDC005288]|uniref:hypothetical protein n=1 Tax=Sphaerisporangium sp. NPDC005288 TaxID=3155114 RepID=UPI00339E271A